MPMTKTINTFQAGDKAETYTTLVVKECGKCGCIFAMSAEKERRCAETGENWFCPNGHNRIYSETEQQKLQKQLFQAQENERLERQWKERERKQRLAAEKKISALKTRVANGVCPCCHRSFQNLRRHMATKHPKEASAATCGNTTSS